MRQAFLGAQNALEVGGWLAEALDLPVKDGLLVEEVTKGGPAAAAGLPAEIMRPWRGCGGLQRAVMLSWRSMGRRLPINLI